MRETQWIGTRWLGVGLASVLAVVTLGLAFTGRLGLYVNPDSTWFAVGMAVVVLVGAVASFALPLGAESEHGHDHGGTRDATDGPDAFRLASLAQRPEGGSLAQPAGGGSPAQPAGGGSPAQRPGGHHRPRSAVGVATTVAGGVTASSVVLLTLILPPASLSAEFAMARDAGAAPLFAGADAVALAATGDTASFGVGDWATVFATATDTGAFDGDPVALTGFVTPSDDGDFDLTRLVITHCVIDAQPAGVPVVGVGPVPETGQWVTITGTVRATADGRLEIEAESVEEIPEPADPYEY